MPISILLSHLSERYIFMQLILLLLTIVLFVAYAAIILYYRLAWTSIPDFHLSIKTSPVTKVSIIITARNEEKNIGTCLDSIQRQQYPKDLLQVIVVDDHSSDNTGAIIRTYHSQNVELITLKDHIPGKPLNSYKKKAIEVAMHHATGDLIITTDSDCQVSANWLQTITAFYEIYHPSFIAAPVLYFSSNKKDGWTASFLKIFQSLDFMILQGITGASVFKRFHSMCNGANMAYEKKAFYAVNGFSGIDNIASGDDMLLMYKIYKQNPKRVLFLKSKDAVVQTQPMDTVGDFLNQRIRWASKADKYNDKRIFRVLLLVYLFHVWLLALGIFAFFIPFIIWWLLACIIGKTIIELFFLYPVAVFFSQQKLLWWFSLAQPFHILYTLIAGWFGKFGSYEWKERMVK